MKDDLKAIAVVLVFCLLSGLGAAVSAHYSFEQKIELEKVRCAK